ncbi:cytochrome b/b6 domain-containing protein [Streptomyces sp. NPDC057798]|uniref:cytochrome b/b6 domain-containing protein n=1 Tax=Streptomyces sp. NPDC057798 TaxID=3346252 RepID=UPI0036A83C1C
MNPRRSTSSLPQPGRSAYGAATAVVLLLIPVAVLVGGDRFREFLNFGAGVLSLVSLSCSVIWGLVAQDRIFLNTRQRIIGQAVHRTTAVAAIAFLLLHITTKIALDHTELIAAVIPFSLGFTGPEGLVGFGSLAGLLMIFVGITGALRGAFASPAPVAARWRAMHMLAYPAWCAALVHGLYAGRAAKPVFVFLYCLCLVGVGAALALRAAPRPVKRRVADKIAEILGTTAERSARDDLDASRARVADSASLPGYERSASPAPEPPNGFAAAYRAVNTPPRPQQSFTADPTARMDLSMDLPLHTPMHVPLDLQPTEALPRMDGVSSTSGNWPIPSPPPVGEAPPSSYDPLSDTGYNIPAYGNPGADGYGGSDVYDTTESNTLYGTYNPNDTYNSGPANEPPSGESFDAPGPGEPWNMPSGGYR